MTARWWNASLILRRPGLRGGFHRAPRGAPGSGAASCLSLLLALAACAPDATDARDAQEPDAGTAPADAGADPDPFVPGAPPILETSAPTSPQPVYLFLFTHTEDPFNHALSEERYMRLAPEVAALDAEFPDAHITWTIEFQGSDAKTVVDRDADTGVATMLRAYAAEGVVEFGYHAHHDPTYQARPQLALEVTDPWEAWVGAMSDWASCGRSLVTGACEHEGMGGLVAVESGLGPVQIVTGFYTQADAALEGDPGVHAVRGLLPNRHLGYGYPDHGSTVDGSYTENLAALMQALSPSVHTSGALFFADGILRLNDGNPVDHVGTIGTKEGVRDAERALDALDRSRPQVINVGFADKWIYTRTGGESPTQWGYAHPDDAELPSDRVRLRPEIDALYEESVLTLRHLAGTRRETDPGLRFVNSAEIVQLVMTNDALEVTPEELDGLCRWALADWPGHPPRWVSDGEQFYSLRELFALLVTALGAPAPAPALPLPIVYGPFAAVDAGEDVSVAARDIRAFASAAQGDFAPADWATTPRSTVAPAYAVDGQSLTAAQLLYAMSFLYSADFAGHDVERVSIPASLAAPDTLAMLEGLQCEGCLSTAWSLKPARIGSLP